MVPDNPTWWQTWSLALKRAGEKLRHGLSDWFAKGKTPDASAMTELESLLLMNDVGYATTQDILKKFQERLQLEHASPVIIEILADVLTEILLPVETAPWRMPFAHQPLVMLMVGVNGAGKTTTIAKLANFYQKKGAKVILAAGDTFRAAAVEQLSEWGEKLNIPVIAQTRGADAAAVLYDALASAQARKANLLIADTAGRLHTQENLMRELSKIKRVLHKLDSSAPQETLLVLDATLGQNLVKQVAEFHQTLEVSGLILTKMDSSAKGGILFHLAQRFGIPVRFVGVGEHFEDFKPFEARAFVNALLGLRTFPDSKIDV